MGLGRKFVPDNNHPINGSGRERRCAERAFDNVFMRFGKMSVWQTSRKFGEDVKSPLNGAQVFGR